MSSKTTFFANMMLDHVTGRTRAPAVTPVVKLYTTTPGVDGTGGVEVTGGAYVVQAVVGGFDVSAGGSLANTAEIVFPVATATWGTIQSIGIFDTTGWNLLLIVDIAGGKVVASGDLFSIPAGSLVLSEV